LSLQDNFKVSNRDLENFKPKSSRKKTFKKKSATLDDVLPNEEE
jgi:hypothetical protein